MNGKEILDEQGVYAGPDNDHDEPTIDATGPAGGGTMPGIDAGGGKRSPVESSPTIGHTIAGRSLDGEGTEEPGVEPGEEESGGGIRIEGRTHLDHE
ncbi:MAG TPA: hypothetical protein VFB58_10765 [Chloroflexota bacterium]|nr:hypothetical protein [Chloroflexota bacterium]